MSRSALGRFWALPETNVDRIRIEPGEAVPGRPVSLELGEALRPGWLPAGRPLSVWLTRRGAEPFGTVLATFVDGTERWPAIVEAEGRITFAFDPDEVIEATQNESYFTPRRPVHSYVSLPYQYVPAEIRLRVFRWLVNPQASGPGFPAWPHDASADALRWVFRLAWCRANASVLLTRHWPDGKRCAFAVSHDVDTAKGVRLVPEVAAFEAGLGVRSSWFVVGNLFGVDPATLDRLDQQGHEIGLHGDCHDNTLAYRSPAEIARRLTSCAGLIERYGLRGFRSPSLLETTALREALRPRFAYASQVPDTEVDSLLGPRRGCSTSFPFLRQGMLEIPITLPMEDKLIMQGMTEAQILDLWRAKAAAIKAIGGVIQLAIHNEPHLLRRCRGAYEQLVRELRADTTIWHATLGQIADWWMGVKIRGDA